MHKAKALIIDLTLLFIITVPAFIRILNNQYFSMHDDQHIVRLYLLDQGLRQGYLYPRWVEGLGFGFGYPLYNFYPPLVYYLAEIFHLLGFSLIWSIKLVFIFGFYLGAVGIYLLVKKLTNRSSGLLNATLYTYFFYHAVLIYVRGALAEFFSLAILPFVFLTLDNLANESNWKKGIFFGVSLALLILSHPLIALPSMIFVVFLFLFNLIKSKFSFKFVYLFISGIFVGLSLSAFFWLPSFVERKFTLTDTILTGELASYKLHYIYPQQFIYSPWGYGGSATGLADGVTFQLGKIHIGLAILSIILSSIYFIKNKKINHATNYFLLTTLLLVISLFMTTGYSSFIWDMFKYLWYLQFPWRFLTFTAIFISIVGGYCLFFMFRLLEKYLEPRGLKILLWQSIYYLFVIFLILGTILVYNKYFKPQRFFYTTDKERTSFDEIVWHISRTSYEFVPKEVKTKKSELNTTVLDIDKKDLPKESYQVLNGQADVKKIRNNFGEKNYLIQAKTPIKFRLNTYNFPGWTAYLNRKKIPINDINDLKLITVSLPVGRNDLKFIFEDTKVRNIANSISISTFVFIVILNLFQHLRFSKIRS